MQNVYLIGMMGSGKTSTGRALASLVPMQFLDLDEAIESQTHLTINEIFRKKGESFFRAEEKRILSEAARGADTVVATGGGVVLEPENVERMIATGRVIYLAASFEALWQRVRDKKDRPLLSVSDPKAVFFRLFQERSPLYDAACHEKVATDGLSPEAVAKQIFKQYLR